MVRHGIDYQELSIQNPLLLKYLEDSRIHCSCREQLIDLVVKYNDTIAALTDSDCCAVDDYIDGIYGLEGDEEEAVITVDTRVHDDLSSWIGYLTSRGFYRICMSNGVYELYDSNKMILMPQVTIDNYFARHYYRFEKLNKKGEYETVLGKCSRRVLEGDEEDIRGGIAMPIYRLGFDVGKPANEVYSYDDEPGIQYYNTFAGFRTVGIDPGDGLCNVPAGERAIVAAWLRHILEVVPNGDKVFAEYLWKWIAHSVQHPDVKPGVVICIGGLPGSGKNMLTRMLERLYGSRICACINNGDKELDSAFNAQMVERYFVNLNEFVATKENKGKFKGLITEVEQELSQKYELTRRVRSYTRYMITTNDEHIIDIDEGDRRFCIKHMSDRYAKKMCVGELQQKEAREYFNLLGGPNNDRDRGLRVAAPYIMWLLQHEDLSNFDVTKYPHTVEIEEQIELSMEAGAVFMKQLILGNVNANIINSDNSAKYNRDIIDILDSLRLKAKYKLDETFSCIMYDDLREPYLRMMGYTLKNVFRSHVQHYFGEDVKVINCKKNRKVYYIWQNNLAIKLGWEAGDSASPITPIDNLDKDIIESLEGFDD